MKRHAILTLSCLLLLLCADSAQSQTSSDTTAVASAPAQRDSVAAGFLQASLAAMGGEVAIGQVQDSLMQADVQGLQKRWGSGTVTWKTSGSSARYEFSAGDASQTAIFGAKDAASTPSGQYQRLAAHERDTLFIPHLLALHLLRRLRDPSFSFILIGTEKVNGAAAVRIRTRWEVNDLEADITTQDWLLDAATGLPLRVEYRLVDNRDLSNSIAGAAEFSDFRWVSGVAVPFRIATYFDGEPWQQMVVSSVVFNSGISPSEFDVPGGVK